MGSEGYLINQFLAERTNQRNDDWGGSLENRLRFAGRDRAPHARGGRPRFHHHLSAVDARPGRRRPELGRDRRAREGRSKPPARRSSTPASAGTRRACRPSSPACRARRSRGSRERLKGEVAHSADHDQPHQHARRRRAHPRRRRRRHGVDGAAAARRPRMGRTRRATDAPTRSTPASPATRPASTTSSRTGARRCLVNPRACHETELVIRPATTQEAHRRGRRRPRRPRVRDDARRARPRGHAVRAGRARSAASSTWPSAFPARRSSTRRCATSRMRIARTGVELRLGTRATPRCCATGLRRGRDRHAASRRAPRRFPASIIRRC